MKHRCRPALLFAFVLGLSSASASTSINAVNYQAYGANMGWLNARGDVTGGAVLGQFYSWGYIWGANVGWISMGSGTPANGWQYSNAASGDWGVNHDGVGNLRGMAYGANIGWINFEDTGDPQVDLLTGNLSGYAYGANVGWISLSNSQAFVQTDFLDAGPDSDGDGIPDAWEFKMVGDLTTLGPYPDDADGDGYPDIFEYWADTHPTNPASFLAITEMEREDTTNTVTWTVQPTRLYRLEEAESVTNNAVWVDAGFGLIEPGAGPTLTRDVVQTNDTPRFYRSRAVVPLAP